MQIFSLVFEMSSRKYACCFINWPLIFTDLMKIGMVREISEKLSNLKFNNKIGLPVLELIHAYGGR
jgi:hypothetical protein